MFKNIFLFTTFCYLLANQLSAQKIKSGKIISGFIECVIIDSTEQAVSEAEMINSMSTMMMPKDTLYFNEEFVIKLKKTNNKKMMDYEDIKTGLIYKFYSDSNEKVYAIDSSVVYFLQDSMMSSLMDSVKIRSEKNMLTSKKSKIFGLECWEVVAHDFKRNEDGYQKLYITKDLGLRMSGESTLRAMEGYPVRIEIAASHNVEVALGILVWEPIPPDNPLFTLPLKEYKQISLDEMYEKTSF